MADSALETLTVDKPYVNSHCDLGEGPYYEEGTNTVRFVDIINKRLHTVSLTDGPESFATLQLDTPITVTADIEGVDPQEKILIGAKYGLAVLDRKSGQYEYLTKLGGSPNERLRTNDGAADEKGRFWLGTMTDFDQGDFRAEGSLLRFDGGKAPAEFLKDLMIPNSVGWSPDNKTMYFTHSTEQKVIAFDYDMEDGSLSNRRVFYHHQGTGDPDGFRVDEKGFMWHAVYGESRVLKISPEGKLVGQIKMPTRNITCVQFVGTELFITTASDPNGEGGETSKEYGGGLFRVDVGVRGLPLYPFKLG